MVARKVLFECKGNSKRWVSKIQKYHIMLLFTIAFGIVVASNRIYNNLTLYV